MKLRIPLTILLSTLAICATASDTTNTLSPREIEGRELARKILEQSPNENSAITGVLKIRRSRKTTELPVQCRFVLGSNSWQTIYETLPNTNNVKEQVVLTHSGTNATLYELNGTALADEFAAVPFAGSDFWLTDFGLDFLRWPSQRVVKKEIRRSRFCVVLESVRDTNAVAQAQGYSRVVSWIDNETTGILHADAYDPKGVKLKEFEPKEFKKVNGLWQLQEMRMDNVQTKSSSWLEFDLTLANSAKK